MRGEFFNDRQFPTLEETQAALDDWVHEYTHDRPHQCIGDRPPIERFRLAEPASSEDEVVAVPAIEPVADETPAPPRITRRVGSNGQISFAGFGYLGAHWLAGEVVEVVSRDGVIELSHRGVLIATHARRHPPGKEPRAGLRQPAAKRRAKPPPGPSVLRLVDTTGSISFAGRGYRVGKSPSRPPRRGRDRRRPGPDLPQRRAAQDASDPPRPDQGTRRLRHPTRTTKPTPACQPGTGARTSYGYRVLTALRHKSSERARIPELTRSAGARRRTIDAAIATQA